MVLANGLPQDDDFADLYDDSASPSPTPVVATAPSAPVAPRATTAKPGPSADDFADLYREPAVRTPPPPPAPKPTLLSPGPDAEKAIEQNYFGEMWNAAKAAPDVLSLPKRIEDSATRGVARLEGMDLPDTVDSGQMARSALGLTGPADTLGDASDREMASQLGVDTDTPRNVLRAVAGKAVEMGTNVATDPLTPMLGMAGKAYPLLEEAAKWGFTALQVSQMPAAVSEAIKIAREKGTSSPEFIEAATGVAMGAGMAAMPFIPGLHGEEAKVSHEVTETPPLEATAKATEQTSRAPDVWTGEAPATPEQPFVLPDSGIAAPEVWNGADLPTLPRAPGEGFAPQREQDFVQSIEAALAEP